MSRQENSEGWKNAVVIATAAAKLGAGTYFAFGDDVYRVRADGAFPDRVPAAELSLCINRKAKAELGPAAIADANVERVRVRLAERAARGLVKYGVTTERKDLTRGEWLRHAQDEALELAVYLERLIGEEEVKGT